MTPSLLLLLSLLAGRPTVPGMPGSVEPLPPVGPGPELLRGIPGTIIGGGGAGFGGAPPMPPDVFGGGAGGGAPPMPPDIFRGGRGDEWGGDITDVRFRPGRNPLMMVDLLNRYGQNPTGLLEQLRKLGLMPQRPARTFSDVNLPRERF